MFDPSMLQDPLLMALLQSMLQGGVNSGGALSSPAVPTQSNPGITQGPDGVWRNVAPENPLPPAEDRWALYGEVGGRGFAGAPVQNQGPNPWAGMTPEELSYNTQVNYMRNQAGSAGMSDKEALIKALASTNEASQINQKYAYTDVLRQNAIDKRASEEESRQLRASEGEAGRRSREAIAKWNLAFKEKNMRVQWSQKAKDAIEVFFRTPIEDPRTRVKRFPNDQEGQAYMLQLESIPSALEDFPEDKFTPPPADNTLKSGGANQTGGEQKKPAPTLTPQQIAAFKMEAQTLGIAEAVKRFMASPHIPQEMKDQLAKIFNGGAA